MCERQERRNLISTQVFWHGVEDRASSGVHSCGGQSAQRAGRRRLGTASGRRRSQQAESSARSRSCWTTRSRRARGPRSRRSTSGTGRPTSGGSGRMAYRPSGEGEDGKGHDLQLSGDVVGHTEGLYAGRHRTDTSKELSDDAFPRAVLTRRMEPLRPRAAAALLECSQRASPRDSGASP